MNGQRWTLTLLSVAVTCFVGASVASSQNLTNQWVETAAGPLIENRVVEGLSVGYIEGKHFGIVHLGSSNQAKQKPNMLTVYEIGSVSKVFTSLLLADAVVRGEIDLNAAADVANSAGIRLPSRDGRSMQWSDLATHRSGLPRLPANLPVIDLVNPYRDYDSKMAAAFLNQYVLPRKPGESQEYSNLGTSVLGYLIAEKVGKSYEQLLRERIAEPLKMSDCSVALSSDQRQRHATPHSKFGSTTPLWTFADLPGAGGIHATIRDMMRFAKAQLTPPGGTLGDAIELAWKQHHDADASGPAMGLGWIVLGDRETRWHNGGTGGFTSSIMINRKLKYAIVIMCNTAAYGEVDQLATQLMIKAAGAETRPERAAPSKEPPKLSPFTAVRFEGEHVVVDYDRQAYQWLELNGIKVDDIVASSKKQFGDLWQKRISEDLVELLWAMGHKPGNAVKLRLLNLKTKQDLVIENAPMTQKNRYAVVANRQQRPEAAAGERGDEKMAIDATLRGRLVGRYQLKPDFIFDVQDRDGHLMIGITNQPTQEVFPDSPTRWSYRGVDATLEFKLPKTGRARSLVLHQNGVEQTAHRIKEPGDAAGDDSDNVAIDEKLRRRLVGRYKLNPNFIFSVRDRDGHLMVGITNQPTQEVFPDSPTRWSYRGVDATLEFKLPKTGRATRLVLHQNGNEQTAQRID